MELLIVEDDARLAGLLAKGLQAEGHVTALAASGAEGLELAQANEFDVIVLDWMLPGRDGLEVARELRRRGCRTPILMLTARDTRRDVVSGLDGGADDYLTKPFAFEELLARLRALARRGPVARGPVLEVGELTLDPAAHQVWCQGRPLRLTPREFSLLELLMRRPGRVFSREALIARVWGYERDVEPNTVDVFVSGLRRKLGAHAATLIQTVRGVGFCLRRS